MTKLITFLIFLLLTVSLSAAETLHLKNGKTHFQAIGHPGFLKINGEGSEPQGKIQLRNHTISGQMEVDLNSFDTGMSLRNRHMKEKYLHTQQHPKAQLKIVNQRIGSQWSFTQPKMKTTLLGILVLHGVEKPVTLNVAIDERAYVNAQFEIKISDFQIDIPSFMGVTVAETVTIQVETQLQSTELNEVL